MKQERYRRLRVLGRMTPGEAAQVQEGWHMLRWCLAWLRRNPRGWLRYHLARPGLVFRLLRLAWCCLVVSALAEPPVERWP